MTWGGYNAAVATDPDGVRAVIRGTIDALTRDGIVTTKRFNASPSPADELAWIIERESGWNPKAQNPNGRATGLIQFLPDKRGNVPGLGVNVDDLATMSLGEQAPYVTRYFERVGRAAGAVDTVGDLYLLTFLPAHVDDPDDAMLADVGSPIWKANPSLRDPGNGPITAGGVRRAGTPPSSPPAIPDDAHTPSRLARSLGWVWAGLALTAAAVGTSRIVRGHW